MKNLILIQLNEINFDYVHAYCKKYPSKFKNFRKILQLENVKTVSEEKYHLLEPWIQWVSVYTNKSFKEHNIFRLGDSVSSNNKQIFEEIESNGYTVGCISPMNAANRLKSPKFFVPDPWTKTNPSDDFWSKALHSLIVQTVNENSKSRITIKSIFILFLALIRFAKFKNYITYLKLALGSRSNPWFKSLFLDLLLSDVHLGLINKTQPDFTSVFLNAGAHIQHHYFHSSIFSDMNNTNPEWYIKKGKDPIKDMLEVYDNILSSYDLLKSYDILTATGLSQTPFATSKYYWRLNDHKKFLDLLNIRYRDIQPRMTRDFLVTFENNEDRDIAVKILGELRLDNTNLFDEIESRDHSIFATLTYPKIIEPQSILFFDGKEIDIYKHVVFVAIKNGEHNGEGFAFLSDKFPENCSKGSFHVSKLYGVIKSFFPTHKKS